jgi:serine/threonine-protein kinase
MAATATACDPDALVRMANRSAPADEVVALRDHLDDCAACRAALLALVEGTAGPRAAGTAAPAPAPGRQLAGTRLGRFVIDGVLGSGAMGTVFAARDAELGREVAIKILSSDAAPSHRLVREAAAMAQIRHRNVVTVHELGRDADLSFVVMERIAGPTLRWALASPPPVDVRLAWLAQIADGLGAIHAAGLVHRDLKPDNIFLERDAGGGERVVIGDLGLAAGDVTAGGADLRATRASGTPAYMAPEQARQLAPDARVDLYAFGVTAWEVLTGRRPFEAGAAAAAPRVAPPVEELPARVPAALARILVSCLATAPAQRPASIDVVRDALRAGAQTRAEPPGPRRRTTVIVAAGGVLIAAGVIVAVVMTGREPVDARPDAAAIAMVPLDVVVPTYDAAARVPIAPAPAPADDAAPRPPDPEPVVRRARPVTPDAAPPASSPPDAAAAVRTDDAALAKGTVLTELSVDLRFRGACSLDPAATGSTVTTRGTEITVNLPDARHGLTFRTKRVSETLDLAATAGDPGTDRVEVVDGRTWRAPTEAAGGRIVIGAYRPFRGVVDLVFEHAVLVAADGSTCIVDGTIRPSG